MSVSIGRDDEKTGNYDEILVSFQDIFNNIWAKAIKERNLHYIGCGVWLHKENLKEILWEFEQVKDYVLNNDFPGYDKYKEYVIERVDNILENLEDFWNEIPGIDVLDMG